MESDVDALGCLNRANVIQMWEEWRPGAVNFMMIQDENTAPGYCFLQLLYSHEPLPVTVNEAEYKDNAIYKRDRVIMKNTFVNKLIPEGQTREGAAVTSSNVIGYADLDRVAAFPCKSFPRSASAWLYQQAQRGNISNQMKRYIETNPCLVVMTGCKGSPYEEYEWRISTSFIERCLMFNLNITQIQCYVMMKLILKTYLNYPRGKVLSSFVCKNILLLCLQCIPFDVWKPHTLLNVFTFCLLKLKQCVLNGECPHFIIHENNLLRRKLITASKVWVVERIDFVIQLKGCVFLSVKIDDFDSRLKSKFNTISEIHNVSSVIINSPEEVSMLIAGNLVLTFSEHISKFHRDLLGAVMSGESDLCNILRTLSEMYFRGSYLEQYACRLLTPPLSSTFGIVKASDDIHRGNSILSISSVALTWIHVGLNSDVASSRLKLASVFYCVGDINRAETILRQIQEQYNLNMVVAVCECYTLPGKRALPLQFAQFAATHNEEAIQHITAFCVRFLPHELRYEMFRSTQEEIAQRDDFWMTWAVIDSLPYLYFLQYKTYSRLQRYDEKCRALSNLATSIFTTGIGKQP